MSAEASKGTSKGIKTIGFFIVAVLVVVIVVVVVTWKSKANS